MVCGFGSVQYEPMGNHIDPFQLIFYRIFLPQDSHNNISHQPDQPDQPGLKTSLLIAIDLGPVGTLLCIWGQEVLVAIDLGPVSK